MAFEPEAGKKSLFMQIYVKIIIHVNLSKNPYL